MNNYSIVNRKGVYYVYIDGEFYCTADSYREAEDEIEEYEKEHKEDER